jgi:hypothetical protein
MNYGKGKVINLGIWGHIVEDNQASLKYFDNVIVPLALCPNDKYEVIHVQSFGNSGAVNVGQAVATY